jgi:4-amino-4-deoxy-L-arabinose transferase
MFYSFASFWALFEYYSSKRIIFLILIGFLSGGAVLCKWLTGLLVFGIWGLIIIYNSKKNNLRQELLRLFLSFLVCLTIFLPWQIFAYLKYPLEYKAAMDFNARHISEPLEGHGGDFSFYYNALFEQFGSGLIIPPIIIICFLFFIYFMKDKTHKIIIFFTGIITYTFFSFVATKMYGYVLVIFPFFILAISFVFNFYLEKFLHKVFRINLRETLRFIMLMFFLFFLFNPGKFYKHHSNKEYGRLVGRSIDIREKELFLNLKKKFGNEKCIIFNCNTSMGSYILSIFYTDYPSFAFVLNEGQIQEAKKSQYKLIAIDDGKLPDYVIDDKSITRVKF